MKRSAVMLAAAAMLLALFAGPASAQGDPRAGTWKLNIAKSQYNPGPPPVSETRTYAVQGKVVSVQVQSVDVKGIPTSLQYAAGDDGKDYPMTGLPFANAIAMRRIGSGRFQVDTKKNGKIVGTTTGEISPDGKVLTLVSSMTTPTGVAIHNIAVYEKQ